MLMALTLTKRTISEDDIDHSQTLLVDAARCIFCLRDIGADCDLSALFLDLDVSSSAPGGCGSFLSWPPFLIAAIETEAML